jgi:uncharacterized protein (TIGR04255 family)
MVDKKSKGRKYKNPPVVEALGEIFFSGSKWDSTLPGLFFDKIKDDYPKKRELEQIGVEVSVSKDMQASRVMHGSKRIQFIKEDGSQWRASLKRSEGRGEKGRHKPSLYLQSIRALDIR